MDTHLAACAIAVALLTGASSAVSAADTGDSTGSGSTKSSDSAPGTGESADHTKARTHSRGTYSGGANANTAADQPGSTAQEGTGDAAGSGGVKGGKKKPVDDNSGTDNGPGGRTITRAPTLLPEAPPPVDLAPRPEEVPPPPLAPLPPPIDQPPGVPDVPGPVDSTTVGASAALPRGNAPPVLTAPVMVAPVPAMPGPILGAPIAPPATFGGPAFTSSSRWSGEPASPIRQASTSEPLPTNVGLTARGQTSKEAGYPSEYLRSPRLSDLAVGALPGVVGMLIMTAGGVCLGYRQAMAGQLLRPQGVDRFLA
ncbi:hypothetical protein ACGFK1_29080 [Mycobacterium sp. NPDC048908]|uniref:hypothetical protein n=1 Tax=Mycobacterium sp. NPDC048908 TaxID=3364292 RepID=UPI0037108369